MKKRRAHSLPSLLLFIGLAAALTFAVAGRFVARQRFTKQLEFGTQAENLASSGLSEMVARVRQDNTWGTTAANYEVQRVVAHPFDAKAGYSLTFDPAKPGHSINNVKGDTPIVSDAGTCPPGAMLLISTGHCNGYTRVCKALVAIPPYPYAIASSGPIRSQAGLTLGSVPAGYDPTQGLDLSKLTAAEMMTQGQDDAGGAALVIKGKSTVVGKVRSAGSADVDLNQVEVRGEIVPHAKTDDVPVLDLNGLDFTSDPSTQTISQSSYANKETLSGLLQSGGNLKFNQGLDLNGATVRVRGNLEINGPLTGVGALLVDGNVTIHGGAQLSSDNQVAILSAGSVSITGTGQGASYVQGLVYAAGADGIKLQDTTVVGTVLNAGKTGSGEGAPMQVERATVALDPRAAKFEVERGFSKYPSGGIPAYDGDGGYLGKIRLNPVTGTDGQLLDPPGPGYFRSIGRTQLEASDFSLFSNEGGAGTPVMAGSIAWYSVSTFVAQNLNDSIRDDSSGHEPFAIDLNKFLNKSSRLRVVWISG